MVRQHLSKLGLVLHQVLAFHVSMMNASALLIDNLTQLRPQTRGIVCSMNFG